MLGYNYKIASRTANRFVISGCNITCRGFAKEKAFQAGKPGTFLMINDVIHTIKKAVHGKRGMHGAFVKLTLKNNSTNSIFEKSCNSDELVEVVELSKITASFSWEDTSTGELVFMNPKTFEEVRILRSEVDRPDLLLEGMDVTVNMHGDNVLGIVLPTIADYKIVNLNQEHMRLVFRL